MTESVDPVPGWTTVSTGPRGATVLLRTIIAASGRAITVAEFPASSTAFHLHVGSQDPPGAAAQAPRDAGAAVSQGELSILVAAFNGGFKREAGAGGVMVDGTVVSPIVLGKAAVAIDADGSLHVGLWGRDLPGPTEQIIAVRENLQLLVDGGQPTAAAHSSADSIWGAAVAGGPFVARSGIGVDAKGNVYFVGAMSAVPLDLAEAMVTVGVVRGMQLDMNPFWVTLGTAATPGAPLEGRIPGEDHSPSIFTSGWQRDFLAVLAKPSLACRLVFPAPSGVATADPPRASCAPAHVAVSGTTS